MEIHIGSIVARNAIYLQEEVIAMIRLSIEKYYSSLAPIKVMKDKGLLSNEQFLIAEDHLRKKYCINSDCLYREIDLKIPLTRVINVSQGGEQFHEENKKIRRIDCSKKEA